MTVSEHPDVVLPAAMIETAARALHEHDRLEEDPDFDDLQPWDQDSYRDSAQVVLAAAFGVCEVRPAWGCRFTDDADTLWFPDRSTAEGRVAYWLETRLFYRLAITTPPEPVDTEGAAT